MTEPLAKTVSHQTPSTLPTDQQAAALKLPMSYAQQVIAFDAWMGSMAQHGAETAKQMNHIADLLLARDGREPSMGEICAAFLRKLAIEHPAQ